MKFPCPHCRKELDFMELSHESDLYAIIKMQPAFGKNAHLVWAYIELFGITPMRAKAKKIRILLEEMKRLFDSESFSYQRRAYQISQAGIIEALSLVVHRNFTDGLDSHNYLKKIMIGIADREGKDAGRTAEKDLRKKEASLMSGSRKEELIGTECNSVPINSEYNSVPIKSYPVQEEQIEAPAMKSMPAARLTPEQIEENRKRLKAMIKDIG